MRPLVRKGFALMCALAVAFLWADAHASPRPPEPIYEPAPPPSMATVEMPYRVAVVVSVAAEPEPTVEEPSAPTPLELAVSAAAERPLTEPEARLVLAAAGWEGALLEEALVISKCESGWTATKTNPYESHGTSYGLFQLWPGWFDYAGLSLDQWADPVANARAALAARLYLGRWGSSGGWVICAAGAGLY